MQQRFSDIERSAGMPRGQFKQYLQSVGVPFEIAVQQIEAQIAWNKIMRRKVRPQVDVSEAEIDDALNRMRTNVGKTESRVAEIFVPIDRADLADEAKRSADRIIEQLKRGAPFGAVAQQFSQGATAQAGGELGWILPGSLDPALDARGREGCRSGSTRSRSAAPPAGISCTSSNAGSSPRRGPTTCAST